MLELVAHSKHQDRPWKYLPQQSAASIELSGTSDETNVSDSEDSSTMVEGAPFIMDWIQSAAGVRGGSA